jgi:hypothetical protein
VTKPNFFQQMFDTKYVNFWSLPLLEITKLHIQYFKEPIVRQFEFFIFCRYICSPSGISEARLPLYSLDITFYEETKKLSKCVFSYVIFNTKNLSSLRLMEISAIIKKLGALINCLFIIKFDQHGTKNGNLEIFHYSIVYFGHCII